jgi:hypothetical protein
MVSDEDYRTRVQQCEAELVEARQVIDRVLARLRDLGTGGSQLQPDTPPIPEIERAGACATNLAAGPAHSAPPEPGVEAPFLLSYCEGDRSYRVGSRRLGLTEMERGILDLLWQSSPKPTARDFIATTLKSSPGSIEVLVSKLRQKLALLSNGHNFIESIRLQGWVLRGPLCDYPETGVPPESRVADIASLIASPEAIPSLERIAVVPHQGSASSPDGPRAF